MALPVVKSALECASYDSTVAPYFYQFQALPGVLVNNLGSSAALRQLYLDINPVISAFSFSLALAPIFLIVSEINKNYSQVDRVWSILPTLYNLHYFAYAHLAGLDTSRLNLVAIVSTIWSTRLTYNYWRKGGYNVGSEDYRWALIKKYIGPTAFFLLNVTFISFGQSLLLCAVTSPTYILLLASRLSLHSSTTPSLSTIEPLFPLAILSAITLSYIADNQQWSYYSARDEYRKTAKLPKNSSYTREQLDLGFNTTGLFAYSRHPNFAAEQSIWITLYLWGSYVSGTLFNYPYYNWTIWGLIAYLGVFAGSTPITEWLSSQKYPEYKEYQRQVGRFLPKFGANGKLVFSKSGVKKGDGHGPEDEKARARERDQLK